MNHQDEHGPEHEDVLDEEEGIEGEAPTVDEYRLSTRRSGPDVSGTS